MPLMFPNLASCRVVCAFATTFQIPSPDEEKKQKVITFFSPNLVHHLRNEHKERGNIYPVLGCGFMANVAVAKPNGQLFGQLWQGENIDLVQPRLEYVQLYQSLHHAFLSEKQLFPAHNSPITRM